MKIANRVFLVSLFAIVCLQVFPTLVDTRPIECMMYNEEYKGEYLYALMGLNLARRSVYTWSPLVIKEFNPNLPENCTNLFTDEEKQAVWVFEPVAGENQTFHIRNSEYKEYLYATSLHSSFFNARRKVFTWKYSTDLDDSFRWQLKQLDKPHKFEIWNKKFDEPLFAASYFFRYDNLRRNVFTWNKKTPDSNQFNWFIKCRNHVSVLSALDDA